MFKRPFLLLLLTLVGCGISAGNGFDYNALSKLSRGVTTYQEAVQLLGDPTNVTRQSDGSLTAMYSSAEMRRSGVRAIGSMVPVLGSLILGGGLGTAATGGYSTTTQFAMLTFDPNGTLLDWNSQQSGSADLVDRSFGAASPHDEVGVNKPTASTLSISPAGISAAHDPIAAIPPPPGHTTGRRVALVIGNSAYRSLGQLRNPIADARLIAGTLRLLGYTIIGNGPQLNLTRSRFEKAIQDFGRAIPGADVALFYYAGHGLQVDGTNWLIPIDAEVTPRKQELPFQMVTADQVLLQMDGAGTQLNVLILDACRNNPLVQSGARDARVGLAEMRAPAGSMIAYATQPGNVALDGETDDSPYSAALAEAMLNRHVDVFHVFNQVGLTVQHNTGGVQVPWMSNSPIRTDISLAGPS